MGYFDDVLKATRADIPWGRLAGKSVLVTGATGLIGSCLVDVLMNQKEGNCYVYAGGRNERRAFKLFNKYWNSNRFHFLPFDVSDDFTFDTKFDYIISAASGANPLVYSTDPVGVMKTTLKGTEHLLEYGRRHGMKRFVFISSGDVYGEGNGQPMDEDYSGYINPLNLRSCYGMAKRAAETLCISYSSQYGLDTVIARPCHVFGPRFTETDSRAYAQFFRRACAGEDIIMKSSGAQLRSWCYVVDCVKGILTVMLKGKSGEAYNIADPSMCLSIREFAEVIATEGKVSLSMESPDEVELRGFSVITNSLFNVGKLKGLGWLPEGTFREKVSATLKFLIDEKNRS